MSASDQISAPAEQIIEKLAEGLKTALRFSRASAFTNVEIKVAYNGDVIFEVVSERGTCQFISHNLMPVPRAR
jgi:hypothetical protein